MKNKRTLFPYEAKRAWPQWMCLSWDLNFKRKRAKQRTWGRVVQEVKQQAQRPWSRKKSVSWVCLQNLNLAWHTVGAQSVFAESISEFLDPDHYSRGSKQGRSEGWAEARSWRTRPSRWGVWISQSTLPTHSALPSSPQPSPHRAQTLICSSSSQSIDPGPLISGCIIRQLSQGPCFHIMNS